MTQSIYANKVKPRAITKTGNLVSDADYKRAVERNRKIQLKKIWKDDPEKLEYYLSIDIWKKSNVIPKDWKK